MFENRITIFTGHFGSGKTEVSINYAFRMAQSGFKTVIVDFDIVNPFFRTADARERLEEKGIKVITPVYANTNADTPSLPAEISSVFEDNSYHVVFDVGGDDLGAKVLSRYNEEIMKDDYVHYFVINTRRPMTRNPEEIARMIAEIQESSRLKVDKLVNNANLLEASTPQLLEEASSIIKTVSDSLSIPVGLICGMEEVLREYKGDAHIERLYLNKYINLPWAESLH